MSIEDQNRLEMAEDLKRPSYEDCDGFRIPGCFSLEAFRSVVDYKPKPGDLFVVTYPKCGTTWMQHIVMLIIRKGKPFVDFQEFVSNTPFVELTGIEAIDLMPGPGAIKLHLPFNLTPFSADAKYIYVARNPKDCCVSFYYHTKNGPQHNFEDGTFDEFFELFVRGELYHGDYFDHLLSWYEHKDDSNVYFVTYEDLKLNTKEEILKIAKFMGDEYYENLQRNPAILEDVLHYSSLSYMKSMLNSDMVNKLFENSDINPATTKLPGFKTFMENLRKKGLCFGFKGDFVRKGIIGDWKSHFTPEQERRMEERIKEKTAGSDVMNLWKSD